MDSQYDDTPRPLTATQQPWNIYNFYATPAKNDPWVPRGVIQTEHAPPGLLPSPQGLVPPPSFLDLASTLSPSDCATLPGDSGYGSSRQAYSATSASVHGGEDSALDSHMGQVMSDCCINPPEAAPAEAATRAAASAGYTCDECNLFIRNRGELKKHKQRHLKSHKCPYASCSKGQKGFSTPNDLVRHKRSVHGEHDLPGRSFVCPRCPPGAKGPKVWPRADNFRSHLYRSHKVILKSDDDHKEYIYKPSAPKHDLKGVGDSLDYVDSEARPLHLNESPSLSEELQPGIEPPFPESQYVRPQEVTSMDLDPAVYEQPSVAADQADAAVPASASGGTRYIHPAVLNRPVATMDDMDAATFATQNQKNDTLEHPSFSHQGFTYNEDHDFAQSTSSSTPRDTASMAPPAAPATPESWNRDGSAFREPTAQGHDDFEAGASTRQCQRMPDSRVLLAMRRDMFSSMASDPSEVVNYLRKFPREFLQQALGDDNGHFTESEGPSGDESGSTFQLGCPDPHCDKNFIRPCELKKHMKRHEKPYGCTFKSCSKTFGSKNDWKRHESSQHFMLEKWDCDEPGCGKTCQRRETFKSHLQKDHGMKDAEIIDRRLESCRSGRHCDPRFWCGFCVRVIHVDVSGRGGNSWTKRCDHIDNHLFGKGGLKKTVMKDWKHQEDQQKDFGSASTISSGASLCPPNHVGDVEAQERKRRSSSEAIFRPLKKATKTLTYMWECCQCFTTMNLKTSSSCVECGHTRCRANCVIEAVSAPENDQAWGEELLANASSIELEQANLPRDMSLEVEAD